MGAGVARLAGDRVTRPPEMSPPAPVLRALRVPRRAASTYEDPQPRLFSFNNPFGACPTCHGFGNIIELDMDLVVPDHVEVDRAERHRAVEQAALPVAARRAEARGEEGTKSGSTCRGPS